MQGLIQSIKTKLTRSQPAPKIRFLAQEELVSSWDGTLLSALPADLHPLIYAHFRGCMFYNKGTIKAGYQFQHSFGASPDGLKKHDKNLNYFSSPYSAAFDLSGRIYVTDPDNSRILVWEPDGTFCRPIGDHSFEPRGIAIDFDGNVIAVDSSRDQIFVLDQETGAILRQFGEQSGNEGLSMWGGLDDPELKGPYNVTIDRSGNYVIADRNRHRIQIFDPDGKIVRRFGSYGSAPGFFKEVFGVAVDFKSGNIIATDFGNHRLQIFTSEGELVRVVGQRGDKPGEFKSPCGVSVDGDGNIIVADNLNFRVQILSPEGQFLMQLGTGKMNPKEGGFSYLKHAVIDKDGRILVIEDGNGRVSVFEPKDS